MISPTDGNMSDERRAKSYDPTRCAGGNEMARYELETAGGAAGPINGDALFELGMMYSAGHSVPVDLVSAHKWFNLASMKGHGEAARMRREIAAEMKDAEIGQAQRAARDWLKAHPLPVISAAPSLRAAA